MSGDALNITYTKTPKGGELSYSDINYNGAVNDEGVRGTVGSTKQYTSFICV